MSTGVLFPGPPSSARSFLCSITQAMIAFTGLVFSITIVVLQLTSGQFSPRVLRAFLRDRGIQLALGVFISTFVYAMVVQRAVTGSVGHQPFVPGSPSPARRLREARMSGHLYFAVPFSRVRWEPGPPGTLIRMPIMPPAARTYARALPGRS